jgi:predicted exporter
LTFEAWRQLSIAETFRPLQIMSNDQQRLEGSIVLLIGELDSVSLAKIVAMAERHEGVRFVNRVDLFSSLLADYRKQITRWLVVVYILLGLMLIMRYRKYGILVIATPALATLSAIGLLQILGQPITLFHMLAAVLVLGIGLDMGIFLRESRAAAHTVIAVSASAITTMLAFGLLALSNTPVLQFFGQMALLGISFSWLISFGLSIFYKGNGGIHGI